MLKITATTKELENILSTHLGISVVLTIDDTRRTEDELAKEQADINRPHQNKIGAIRQLREAIPGLGLAEAKYAIERYW